jgi:hypothetical protein
VIAGAIGVLVVGQVDLIGDDLSPGSLLPLYSPPAAIMKVTGGVAEADEICMSRVPSPARRPT